MSGNSIHIVGGGVAGLVLGNRLLQLGVNVDISEAGDYPRHKVCGEYISGRGIELLKKLQLFDPLISAGGKLSKSIKFYGQGTMSPVLQMPQSALCISRYAMDHIMSREFKSRGGNLYTNQRFSSSELSLDGKVFATGRKPTMDRRSTWTGYKFHIQGLKLEADLEMHFSERGYLGMCEVENGVINVCGLLKTEKASSLNLRSDWYTFLRSNLHPHKHECLKEVKIVKDSISCVSGISYKFLQTQKSDSKLTIGDLMSTIPPLTGNGMSLAIESALMAADPIASYAKNRITWKEVVRQLRDTQMHTFKKRLMVSVPLQEVLMSQHAKGVREYFIKQLSYYYKPLFRLTR